MQPRTDEIGPNRLAAPVGTACLVFAALVACMAFVDGMGGLPFSMPRSWYTNRSLWYLLGLVGLVTGSKLLGSASSDAETGRGGSTAALFNSVILYTRPGCHLCEDALELLSRYQSELPAIEQRNIDEDAALTERFGTCIPVVEIDGKVRFRGRVSELLLQRLIDAARVQRKEVV